MKDETAKQLHSWFFDFIDELTRVFGGVDGADDYLPAGYNTEDGEAVRTTLTGLKADLPAPSDLEFGFKLLSVYTEVGNVVRSAFDGEAWKQRDTDAAYRVLAAAALTVAARRSASAYTALMYFLFFDQRIEEWFPADSAHGRVGGLLRAITDPWTPPGDEQTADPGDEVVAEKGSKWDEGRWPYYLVDTLGVGASIASVVAEVPFDLRVAYGLHAAAASDSPEADELGKRTLTLWLKERKEAVALGDYIAKPAVPGDDVGRDGVSLTLMPVGDLYRHKEKLSTYSPADKSYKRGLWVQAGIEDTVSFGLGKVRLQVDVPGAQAGLFISSDPSEGDLAADARLALSIVRQDRDKLLFGFGDVGGEGFHLSLADASLRAELSRDPTFSVHLDGLSMSLKPSSAFWAQALPSGLSGKTNLVIGCSLKRRLFVERGRDSGGVSDASTAAGTQPITRETPTAAGSDPYLADTETQRFAGSNDFNTEGPWGPKIHDLRFRIVLQPDGVRFGLGLCLEVDVRLDLGPVSALAEGLGLRVGLVRNEPDANADPIEPLGDITLPHGFGLRINTKLVSGGGMLLHDKELDRYAGALALKLSKLSLAGVGFAERGSVMGIVFARDLARSPGWALDGLGVLVAIDRRPDRAAFLEALQGEGLDALLFPDDPIAKAPQIVRSMARLFPYAEGHHVFGAMARIIYGGANVKLVSVELGVLLEFKGKSLRALYVIGQAVIEKYKKALRIKAELYGEIDFEKNEGLLRLELRDSHIAGYALTGSGAYFQSKSLGFAATLGGFHPRYPITVPELRGLKRLSVGIKAGDNVELTMQQYIALTCGSFQFGSKAHIEAKAGGLSIVGWLEFDVFVPFDCEFMISLNAGVALRKGSRTLACVELSGTLSGASRWRIAGKAKLKLLFLSISFSVSAEFGGRSTPPVFAPPNLLEELTLALRDPSNWAAQTRDVVLTPRAQEASQQIRVAPEARPQMRQNTVPLNRTIERYGPAKLTQPQALTIDAVKVGSGAANSSPEYVQDQFSAALFFTLSDDELLSAPAFESMDAGVVLGTSGFAIADYVDGGQDYEEIQIGGKVPKSPTKGHALPAGLLASALTLDLPSAQFYTSRPHKVAIEPATWVIADAQLTAQSQPRGYFAARELKRKDTSQNGKVQMVRAHESKREVV